MIFERFVRSGFARSVVRLGSATVIGQSIGVCATPALSRLYTPSDFGVLATFTAIAATLLAVSSLRYELAIPITHGERNAKTLLFVSVAINIVFAFASLAVVGLFGAQIARTLGEPLLRSYLWLLPVFLLGAGGYRIYTMTAIRNKDFRLVSRTKVTQMVASVAVQVGTGIARIGALGLLTGFVMGNCVGLVALVRKNPLSRPSTPPRRPALMFLRAYALMRRYSRFPKYDVVAALADTLGAQIPNILLAMFFSVSVAGCYAMASRLLWAPATVVGQAVGQVFLGVARDYRKTGILMARLRLSLLVLALLVFPFAVIVFFAAVPTCTWLLGLPWVPAGAYAQWIVLGVAAQFVYSPVSMLLLATEGQHINLVIHASLLAVKILAVYVVSLKGSALDAVIAVSLVNFVGYLFATALLYWHVARHVSNKT